MLPKVGPFSLGMAIAMVISDKGSMTKEECFGFFKSLEITNREFNEAWKELHDWGQLVPNFHEDEDGKDVYEFVANQPHMEEYVPQLWEILLGDTPKKEYRFTITCKEMHRDRVIWGMRRIPGVLEIKIEE